MAKAVLTEEQKEEIKRRFDAGEDPALIAETLKFDGEEGRPHPMTVWGVLKGGPKKVTETTTTRKQYVEGEGGSASSAEGPANAPLFQAPSNNPISRVEVIRQVAFPASAGTGYLADEDSDVTRSLINERWGAGVYKLIAYNQQDRVYRVTKLRIAGESIPASPLGEAIVVPSESAGELAELRKMFFDMNRKNTEDARQEYKDRLELERDRLKAERELERDRQAAEAQRQREWMAMMDKQQKEFLLSMAQLRQSEESAGGADDMIETFLKLDKLRGGGSKDPITALAESGDKWAWIKDVVTLGGGARPLLKPGQAQSQQAQQAQGQQQAQAQNNQGPQAAPQQDAPPDLQQIGMATYLRLQADGMSAAQAEETVRDLLGHINAKHAEAAAAQVGANGAQPKAPAQAQAPTQSQQGQPQ